MPSVFSPSSPLAYLWACLKIRPFLPCSRIKMNGWFSHPTSWFAVAQVFSPTVISFNANGLVMQSCPPDMIVPHPHTIHQTETFLVPVRSFILQVTGSLCFLPGAFRLYLRSKEMKHLLQRAVDAIIYVRSVMLTVPLNKDIYMPLKLPSWKHDRLLQTYTSGNKSQTESRIFRVNNPGSLLKTCESDP